ncbi:hypothetical protein [Enterovibrio norvegicus]|uniref:hypothetical protein n=1 Tax=Enterovibrio norvegicus TaxID=188144 RepID=UPI000C82CA59|nr:hypothetical protein [Vibrio sp. 10N.286.48.B7]PMH78503.1 hypothetical protein BCU58_09005 [Vibrio sp. 10N.286.48.B7]
MNTEFDYILAAKAEELNTSVHLLKFAIARKVVSGDIDTDNPLETLMALTSSDVSEVSTLHS